MPAFRPRLAVLLLPLVLVFPACERSGGRASQRAQQLGDQQAQLERLTQDLQQREAAFHLLQQEQNQRLSAWQAELAERAARLDETQAAVARELDILAAARETKDRELRRGTPPEIHAGRAIVVDASSGEILLRHHADQRGPIASTQKLLTALVVARQGDLDRLVTITKEDVSVEPTRSGVTPGEQFSRRQLLNAMLVRSCNDIAHALARDSGGSIEGFAKLMNQTAVELGATNSHFTNPHGLPDDAQYSTAHDLALIARAADAEPDIREAVEMETFQLGRPGKEAITFVNTNRVMRTYEYCDGMKTGYTRAAGKCLVASGERDGNRRIVVVLNDVGNAVWTDARALLEWSQRG